MTQTLGELLKHRRIKQVEVKKTLKNKYDVNISTFHYLCHKEGDWFSKYSSVIQECLKKEYGIYYDGSVWRGGENYDRK